MILFGKMIQFGHVQFLIIVSDSGREQKPQRFFPVGEWRLLPPKKLLEPMTSQIMVFEDANNDRKKCERKKIMTWKTKESTIFLGNWIAGFRGPKLMEINSNLFSRDLENFEKRGRRVGNDGPKLHWMIGR